MKQDPFPLHREHQAWLSDHRQWQHDLEAWRRESAALTGRLVELLGAAMQRHERELAAHSASIDMHETAIAEEVLGGDPDDSLRSKHEHQDARHRATRARHHGLATALRQLRELVSALEVAGTTGEPPTTAVP